MNPIIKVFAGANIASLLQLKHGVRTWARTCALNFRLSSRRLNPWVELIPETPLSVILGQRSPKINLVVSEYRDGMLPYNQSLALLSIAVAELPSSVLEVGTFMGHTTRQLAENLPNALVHTVDLPTEVSQDLLSHSAIPKDDFHLIEKRKVGAEYVGTPEAERIRQHFADTATWDFEPGRDAGLFFIDGSHTYEYCKNDSEKCLAVSKPGSVFVWHDCDPSHPGVAKCLVEWRRLNRDVRRIEGTPLAYWKRPLSA